MTTRTFKQFGQAYGSTPATITASIDGVEVYSGEVSTLDQPFPSLPDLETSYGTDLFSWTANVDFTGTQNVSITISGASLLLTDTVANYIAVQDPSNPSNVISGGADVYGSFYNTTVGDVVYSDPFTDEEIDGIAQETSDPSLTGQWYWTIPAGSTFTATVNIQAGLE